MIRFLDIVLSVVGLLILSPLFLIIPILIRTDSKGRVVFCQERIGMLGKPFIIYKFRTMSPGSDNNVQITLNDDTRITRIGRMIRRLKLDEIPQLLNVLKGEMSLVGPRPEVSRYVEKYTEEQKKILTIKPGMTDVASIVYFNEGQILKNVDNPQHYYETVVIPQKIELNYSFFENQNLKTYFSILIKTSLRIIRSSNDTMVR